ncbi:MAG: sulfatase [Deltaproteobacteria bacterium]|nr:sulfatase [Deltaproteobacteria bacterium]
MGVLVVTLLLACADSVARLPPGHPSQPDLVLVSIDSLRADHLGSYGNPRDVSPFLDQLAASGLRFENALASSPWTLPSHVTMLSGRGPLEHNVIEDDRRIPGDLPLVAERLRDAGYATGGFVSTIYVSSDYGFDRGFDTFVDYDLTKTGNLQRQVRAEKLVDDALAWLSAQPGKPAFLFVHLYDVHYPYLPPEPWGARYDKPGTKKSTRYKNYAYYKTHPLTDKQLEHQRAQYDECIRYVDDQLARLHAALERAGRKNTWVVTADHGEEFGERGSWGHAHTLHPEVMRVPLIVSDQPPAVRQERAGVIDVAPTLMALAGLSMDTTGLSLLGPLPSARDWPMETSRFDTAKLSLVSGLSRVEIDNDARVAYDWSRDPGERQAAPATPEQVAAAWAAVGEAWTATSVVRSPGSMWSGGTLLAHEVPAGSRFALYPPDATVLGEAQRTPPLPPRMELSDDTREQLEALGYQQ